MSALLIYRHLFSHWWMRPEDNKSLLVSYFIFKRHGHNFLPSILWFIDGFFKTQPAGKWNSREEPICIQLYLLQFYILTFHVRIFTLEIKEAGTVEIVTYALSLYLSTKEKELSHDNCFRSFSFLFCRHISELKLIYDPNLLTRKYLIISFKNRN